MHHHHHLYLVVLFRGYSGGLCGLSPSPPFFGAGGRGLEGKRRVGGGLSAWCVGDDGCGTAVELGYLVAGWLFLLLLLLLR